MLVLSRREGEKIEIATSQGLIVITVTAIQRSQIQLGIEAPREMIIRRQELKDKPREDGGER